MIGAGQQVAGGELPVRRPPNPTVWLLRLLTVAMLCAALWGLWRRLRSDPAQEELARYATLTVPAYLDEVARLHALMDRLSAPGLSPAQARTLLVDEAMPQLVRMRRRAEAVPVSSPAVRAANAEYLAALDGYLSWDRAAVRAIDEPQGGDAQAEHQAIVALRRQADEAVRQFVSGLRRRAEEAGFQLVPAASLR
jgi:hypothetical protein